MPNPPAGLDAIETWILRPVPEEPRIAIARRVFDAWEEGDFASNRELLADDLEVSWAEPPVVVTSRGREEITERLALLLHQWDDFRAEAEELVPVGESSVLVIARQYGRGKESGVEVDARVHIVISVRDAEVTGVHWHFDRDAAMRAAGIQDAPE